MIPPEEKYTIDSIICDFLIFRQHSILNFTIFSKPGENYNSKLNLRNEYNLINKLKYLDLQKTIGYRFNAGTTNKEKIKVFFKGYPEMKLRDINSSVNDISDIDLLTFNDKNIIMQTGTGLLNFNRDIYPSSNLFVPLDIGKSYLAEAIAFFKSIFGKLPSGYFTKDFSSCKKKLNFEKTMNNVESSFEIVNKFIYKYQSEKKKNKIVIGDVNYIIKDEMLIYLSDIYSTLIVLYNDNSQLDKVLKCIDEKKVKENKLIPKFYLLNHSGGEFFASEFNLKKFKVNTEDNYNDDLPNEKIINFINSKHEAGLCILHGKPGTGKTFYIRHLIKSCHKDFIYMNKECLQFINEASFISFLTEHKESVFILEDCENVLADRTDYNNTISTLLNLSDGLLGDSLNNKFICTFNTDINKIDGALLRKGRMKICYEFKELNKDKANKLSKKLGLEKTYDKDTLLCEILNTESNGNENIKKTPKKIGF